MGFFTYPRWLGMGISEPSTVSRHTSTVSQVVVCDTLPKNFVCKTQEGTRPLRS